MLLDNYITSVIKEMSFSYWKLYVEVNIIYKIKKFLKLSICFYNPANILSNVMDKFNLQYHHIACLQEAYSWSFPRLLSACIIYYSV